MTTHFPPFDVDGLLPLTEDGEFVVPPGFTTNTTMHTTHATVVFHKDARTRYETGHPELSTDDGVFVAFKPHGEDEFEYWRLLSPSHAREQAEE